MFHKHGGDIYSYKSIQDFSANINFRGMPETVREAAMRAVDASVHYPDPEYRTLRAALARRENIPSGCSEITPDQIICGNGAAELMFSLSAALKPKRALLAAPSFFEYEQALTAFGCEIRYFYLEEERGFRLDESFFNAVTGETDIIILGNPNNPTGQLIEKTVLEKLLEICRQKHIFLVLDESFFDFLSEEDRMGTLAGVRETAAIPDLFVLKSFTKMYAMPGLRFGYGVCSNTELLEKMRVIMQPWNVSVPAQAAAEAAASELVFAVETAKQVSVNREQMRGWMEQAGYSVFPSCTNYLMFQGPGDLKEFCLEHGYLIRDCSNFPGLEKVTSDKSYFRICIRSSQENESLMEILKMGKQEKRMKLWQK